MVKQNKNSNLVTIFILAVVLLVPGFLYVALNKVGSNSYVMLPVFGEKSLSGKINHKMGREIPDTIFHTIDSLHVIDGNGTISSAFINDSTISVVHLFYGKDEGLSKSLLRNFRTVVDRFDYNSKIKFYSISIDSSDTNDDLLVLKNQFNPDNRTNWSIVKPRDVDILNFVKTNFLLDAIRVSQDSSKYIFSNNYILIDSKNRIRGFYDINLKTDLDRLEDEIKVQVVEELRNNPPKIVKK